MGNENVEPVRNPTRHNKTIKKSGYTYDETEEAEKKFESEDDSRRSGKTSHGDSNREETDLHGGGRLHSQIGESHSPKRKKKQ